MNAGDASSDWKPGQKIPPVDTEFITVNSAESSVRDFYRLMLSVIVPRPIAFVSTVNRSGAGNLAPFSFYNGICSNPPCLVVSVARKPDGQKKDTLRNIEETGQFVVNSASESLTEPLVHSGAEYPFGVDEREITGLTALASLKVLPARIAESVAQFECEVYKTVEIGDGSAGSATLVIGHILLAHVAKASWKDGAVDPRILKPISRWGGLTYGKSGELFERKIPKV